MTTWDDYEPLPVDEDVPYEVEPDLTDEAVAWMDEMDKYWRERGIKPPSRKPPPR